MTNLLQDILNQPGELQRCLQYTLGSGWEDLQRAADLLDRAKHLYISGIGASWHAGMAVQSMFQESGRPSILVDASELLHFAELPAESAVLILSRSGLSVEVRQLLAKAKERQAPVIAITNDPNSPLAKGAAATLLLDAAFDHQVSITMYSAVALVGVLLASHVVRSLDAGTANILLESLRATADQIPEWQREINNSEWLSRDQAPYFLARGASLASCHEARLLWEEAAKSPASAMATGAFRHGPQEIVTDTFRAALWIDNHRMRAQDLALARDLRQHGARVLLIGQGLASDSADLVLNVPAVPPRWQFLVDIFPAQLAAERLSHLRGVNCDVFRLCSYVVESEGGLYAHSVDPFS